MNPPRPSDAPNAAPAPVLIDRRGHLAQLGTQALLGSAAYVTQSWIPLASAAVVFGISAVVWPHGAAILRLWDRLAAGRGTRWLDDSRPPRISTAIAAVNFAGIAAAVALDMHDAFLWAGLLAMCGALVAEVVIGACVPCELVVWAARRGWLRYRTPIGDTQ